MFWEDRALVIREGVIQLELASLELLAATLSFQFEGPPAIPPLRMPLALVELMLEAFQDLAEFLAVR